MSEYITDVSNWKNYPFLNNVWDIYMEFDNTLKGDTNYNNYEGVCEGIVKNYGEEKAKHKDFCMKLVRNLGCYNLNTKYYNPNNDRCIILYNWIHNTKKNYIHSDEIITKCFNDYIEFMDRTIGNYMCSYDSYNAIYEDPIKMTILDIFNNNMQNIKRKLMEEREKGKFSAQNFVCGSVNIYRKMYRNYCNDQNARDKEHKNTCDQLNALRTIYNSYIFQNVDLKNKIPALDDREEEFWDKCKSDEKLPEKAVVAGPEEPTLQHSYRDEGESTPQAMPYEVDNVEKQVNPTSSTVSTAVGTVAGASSILALLYKFSPARRWVHSGIRGNRGRIGSNFYEGPNELLYDAFKDEDMSTHNTRYNIGYGTEGIYE